MQFTGIFGVIVALYGSISAESLSEWHWDFDGHELEGCSINNDVAELVSDSEQVLEGGNSLLIDTTGDAGWVTALSLNPGGETDPFPAAGRYEIEFTYRILDRRESRPGSEHPAVYVWADPGHAMKVASGKTGSTPIGRKETLHFWFVQSGEFETFKIRVGGCFGIRAVIDSITVRMKPQLTAEQVTAAGETVKTTGYEPYGIKLGNLTWKSCFPTTNDVLHVMDLARDAGVQWIRLEARHERWLYEAVRTRGMKAYACLNVPDILKDLTLLEQGWNKSALPPVDVTEWHDYIDRYYSAIGDLVDYWEIGNEINHSSFYPDYDAYITYYIDTAQYLKAKDSKNRIAPYGMGRDGVAAIKNYGVINPLDRLFAGGAGPCIDWLSVHSYQTDIAQVIYHINELCRIVDQYGYSHLPIWLTETGLNIGRLDEGDGAGGGLQQQAGLLRDTYTCLLKHPRIDKIFWFNMVYKHADNVDFGICEKWDYADPATGEVKPYESRPAYEVLKNLNHSPSTVRPVNRSFIRIDDVNDRP